MANSNLHKAKKVKQDEFYTQLTDIEKEMKHYRKEFFGKKIFLNCDDPQESNFWRFFSLNFDFLSLKELTATHYNEGGISYKLTMKKNGETIRTDLKGDGDFRSDEAIGILKKSDIVVTNPPFSLFREYIAQLIEYDKKFIIVGSMNAITYKEIFKHIKNNKLWLGNNLIKEFMKPDGTMKKFGNINWYTNLEHSKRNVTHEGYKEYTEVEYPKYENYDAININRAVDIPEDYYGEMGIPISFLDKLNPTQFEIVALGIVGSIKFTKNEEMFLYEKKTGKIKKKKTRNAKGTLYTKHNPERDKSPAFKHSITGENYNSIYARVIIKRIK